MKWFVTKRRKQIEWADLQEDDLIQVFHKGELVLISAGDLKKALTYGPRKSFLREAKEDQEALNQIALTNAKIEKLLDKK